MALLLLLGVALLGKIFFRRAQSIMIDQIRALIRNASIEMTCKDTGDLAEAATLVPQGTDIFIALFPNQTWDDLTAAAKAVGEAGFNAVPHVPARRIKDRAEVAEIARKLTQVAGAKKMLLIAGDMPAPEGAFDSTIGVLETGELAKAGIKTFYMAGHPEGHAHMTVDQQRQFEARKVALSTGAGLRAEVHHAGVLRIRTHHRVGKDHARQWHHQHHPPRPGWPGQHQDAAALRQDLRCRRVDPRADQRQGQPGGQPAERQRSGRSGHATCGGARAAASRTSKACTCLRSAASSRPPSGSRPCRPAASPSTPKTATSKSSCKRPGAAALALRSRRRDGLHHGVAEITLHLGAGLLDHQHADDALARIVPRQRAERAIPSGAAI